MFPIETLSSANVYKHPEAGAARADKRVKSRRELFYGQSNPPNFRRLTLKL